MMNPKALPPKLAQTMKEVRQAHPLPGEHLASDERGLSDLLLPLKKLEPGEWNRFCTQLHPRLERLIFPCFLHVHETEARKRLQQLCRERCSWSLYEQAWRLFQEHFPDRTIQLAFAEVYAMLRRDPKRYGPAPSYILDFLPARVDFSLQADVLLQNSFALLSEHMNEQQKLWKTPAKPSAANLESPYRKLLQQFFRQYSIVHTTSFGAALCGRHLLACDDATLFEERRLFSEIIGELPREQFIQLLDRVSQSVNFSEEQRSPLFQLVFHTLEQNEQGAELWRQIPRRTRQNLLRWHIWNVMQEHYAMNPRKEKVLQHFSRSIEDVVEIDSKTVAWRFKDFVIVDSWNDMDYSYYYPQALFDGLMKNRRKGRGFLETELPYRILSPDNLRQAATGAVRLGFVVPQLEHTVNFLALLTGQKPLGKTPPPLRH